MMEEEGIDMSGFNYDDLPDAPDLVEPRRKKKKSKKEVEEPKEKKSKKQKKEKVIGLSSYSEPSDRGNFDKPSSGVFTSTHLDTIPSPPNTQQTTPPIPTSQKTKPTNTSTQIPTPIPSQPIQITTPAIISTTSDQTPIIYLNLSDSETTQPIPLSHSFPPLNLNQQQSDSDVTLSNYSPEKSADFLFPDTPSPTIQSLPKPTQTPSSTTFIPDTIASGTLPFNPILEPITSQPPTSAPITSEPLTSEPIISPSEPIITEPSESNSSNLANPSSKINLHIPKPQNLLECINLFRTNASKKVSELMASTSVHPAAVQKDWEEFQYWMHSGFEYLHNFSELEKVASIKAAHERKEAWEQAEAARIAEKRRAAEEREAQLMISVQETIEKAEMKRLEALRAEEARVQEEKEEEARAEAARS